jgi:hypothetical protein
MFCAWYSLYLLRCGSCSEKFGKAFNQRESEMQDKKEIASRLAAEAADSAHLFFAPVRAIVNEFAKAVGYSHEQEKSPPPSGPKKTERAA